MEMVMGAGTHGLGTTLDDGGGDGTSFPSSCVDFAVVELELWRERHPTRGEPPGGCLET